jgi:hypothetical protein
VNFCAGNFLLLYRRKIFDKTSSIKRFPDHRQGEVLLQLKGPDGYRQGENWQENLHLQQVWRFNQDQEVNSANYPTHDV